MNDNAAAEQISRNIENVGMSRLETEILRIQRTKGFAYRKTVKIPLSIRQLFIHRDMPMLEKKLNVKMIFPEPTCLMESASLDIYGLPKKVDLACRLVQMFVHYEETTEICYTVDLTKYENLLRKNPNIFVEICAKSKVTMKFHDLSATRRNVTGVAIKGKRTQIDNASKFLAELFFPKFECALCIGKDFVHNGVITCEKELHCICVDCLRDHAHYSIHDGPVAHGGIGLPCVYPGCNDAILLSSFEKYIPANVCTPLKLRLQQQCLIDANVEDLVSCSVCNFKTSVETTLLYYKCRQCGRIQCRHCPRLYEGKHKGKTCKQMDEEEAQERSAQKLESKISETIIRKCHRVACNLQFVKTDGCNKMTCRCKATQCYICREKDITYQHFCQCQNTRLQQQHGRCPRCKKTCRLFENAEELDELRINVLQNKN